MSEKSASLNKHEAEHLLEHWIEHNESHSRSFRERAKQIEEISGTGSYRDKPGG